MSEDFKDYYAILNIPPDADQELINEAYRKLSSFTHPDRQPEERKKWAEERQKDLNEAYDILKDPGKRKEYDEQYKLYQEFLSRFRDEIEKNAQRDVDNKANERSHTYSQSSDKPVGCIGRLFTWLFILFILGIISHTIKYCSRNENTIQNSSNKTNSSIIYDATNNTNSSMAAANNSSNDTSSNNTSNSYSTNSCSDKSDKDWICLDYDQNYNCNIKYRVIDRINSRVLVDVLYVGAKFKNDAVKVGVENGIPKSKFDDFSYVEMIYDVNCDNQKYTISYYADCDVNGHEIGSWKPNGSDTFIPGTLGYSLYETVCNKQ